MSFMSEGEDRCLLFRVIYICVGLRLLAHEPHDSFQAKQIDFYQADPSCFYFRIS
jgi:hypothetical protein